MKRIALSLVAFALFGALAFADDMAAPVAKLSGYVGTGAILSGSGNQDTQIQPADRNNGGPVDFRLNLSVASSDTTGLQFSLWNSTGSIATTNLQYTYAWASFLDKQLTTKVGLQDDNTTGSENMGYGTNDNNNTTGTNNAVAAKFAPPPLVTLTKGAASSIFSNTSGNTPAFDAVYKPASIPGLALDYYVPFGWSSVYAPDAFGLSRIGAAYVADGLGKVTFNYELDQTSGTSANNGAIPSVNFGVVYSAIENLKVRVEGSAVTNSSAYATSAFIQDVGYTIKLNDTDTVTPYIFVREFLVKSGAGSGYSAAKAGDSYVSIELMPQVAYTSGPITYAVDADIYNSGASLASGANALTYAVQPNVTVALSGSQKVEVAGSYGTLGSDVADGGGHGQNYGTYFNSNYGQTSGGDLWIDYIYSF
jgi:hypothetical protein